MYKDCLEPLRERLDRICTILLSALVKRSQTTLHTASEHRVLDLTIAPTSVSVAGTSSVTLQVVQQYVSPMLVGSMTSLTVNSKGVLHVLTQNTSNPSLLSLVSINAANGQTQASCT